MYGYIYKTTNLYNGKIYVGQHRSEIFDDNYYGSGVRFANVFNKYGKNSFICELLEECNSEQELNEREIYWINELQATDPTIGYNLMSGGYRTRGVKHSQETKDKISSSKTGHKPNRIYTKQTDEIKLKISNTLKEYYKTHDNPRKGCKLSDSTKEKLRQANLGKKYPEEVCAKHRGRPAYNRGVPMTEEAKEHLRQLYKGKPSKMSEEAKLRAKERWSGKNNPNYGGLSDTTKERIRQAIKGRIWINNGVISKQIKSEDEEYFISQGFVKGRIMKNKK